MTRALFAMAMVAAVFGGAACKDLDTEASRRYLCDPEKDDPNQCPGGSVCGLDHYCHGAQEAGAWLCRSDDDCPGAEGALWHCGYPNGFDNPQRCYDRAAAEDIACRYDAGVEDCAPEWKCGLNERCHDATPRAYACASDDDCEGGWRCGVDALCHDTSKQALREPRPLSELRRERVSPQLPGDVSAFYLDYSGRDFVVAYDGGVAWVKKQGFPTYFSDGGYAYATRRDLSVVPTASAVLMHTEAVGGEDGLYVVSGDRLKNLRTAFDPDGKALTLAQVPENARLRMLDYYGWYLDTALLFSGQELVTYQWDSNTDEESASALVTLPDAGVAYGLRDVVEVEPPSSMTCSGGCYGSAIATTQAGLMYAPRRTAWTSESGSSSATPEFRPVDAPGLLNAACGTSPAPDLGRLRWYDDSWHDRYILAVELAAADGGSDVYVATYPANATPPEASCASLGLEQVATCGACPAGATLDEFTLDVRSDDAGVSQPVTYARCASVLPDGGVQRDAVRAMYFPDGGCEYRQYESLLGNLAGTYSTASQQDLDFVDRAGRPWSCSSDPTYCFSSFMTKAPDVIAGSPEGKWMFAMTPVQVTDSTGTQWFPLTYKNEPGVGFVRATRGYDDPTWEFCLNDYAILASLSDRPDLFITHEKDFASPTVDLVSIYEEQDLSVGYQCSSRMRPVARLQNPSGLSFALPNRTRAFGQTTATPDGGTALVVAMGDRVWAGEVSERLADRDAGTPALPVRAVPAPFQEIDGLTVLAPSAETNLWLDAYVTVQRRLFRVLAPSPAQYLAREVTVPGEALAVFSDGERGRVGLSDGRVYSLPDPVLIGPALPEGDSAQDFADLCGEAFAIGARGVYRLEPVSGQSVGAWRRLDLEDTLTDDPALWNLQGARFHRGGGSTYLVTAQGLVVRLRYDSCAAATP